MSQSHHPFTILVADPSVPVADAFGEAACVVLVEETDLLTRAREHQPDVIVLAAEERAAAHCDAIRCDESLRSAVGDGLDPDLVITDVVMPGMSGNQLVARLRSARMGLRVLYTSGFSHDAVVHHGVSEDEHFLSKPFTPSDLAHNVRDVLGGRDSN